MNRESVDSVRLNEPHKRFRTFEDLEVYQVARAFRRAMYGVIRRLPEAEKFALASQMRRAAISLTNNIAEGHGRYHYLDQIKFTLQARGSLEELIDDLNICEDEHYLTKADVAAFKQEGWRVSQLIGGYIRHLRDCKAGESLALHEGSPAYGQHDDELDSTIQRSNDSTILP